MCVGGVGRGEDRSCAALPKPAVVSSSLKTPLSMGGVSSRKTAVGCHALPSRHLPSPGLLLFTSEPPEKTVDGHFVAQIMNETSNWPPFHNFIRKALMKIHKHVSLLCTFLGI